MDGGREESGWKTVTRRRTSTGMTSKGRREDDTFFFTRFPEDWDRKALIQMFQYYGSMEYLFVADKRTAKGTRFGFVRFHPNIPLDDLERRLGSICIGNSRLVINKAKFGKKNSRKMARS